MKETKSAPKAEVIPFPTKRKRAPRRGGPSAVLTSGNLALAAAPAQKAKPIPFPTPARWFSESHGSIGFRLFDLVYMFSLCRQALTAEEAIEWGARYFSGALSEGHGRTVLDVLSPGRGDEPTVKELPEAIRQGFRDAILQGASRLLGRPHLTLEAITEGDAKELQHNIEALYEQNGWLLPAMPLTLHRILRYSGLVDDY